MSHLSRVVGSDESVGREVGMSKKGGGRVANGHLWQDVAFVVA
jgi:hypothetical protein